MSLLTVFFLFWIVILVELLIVVTVTIAPQFRSTYAKTRVGAVFFFLMSAAARFQFVAHAWSGGILIDDYGAFHHLYITVVGTVGLALFMIGLYADQKVDTAALPNFVRFGHRLVLRIADSPGLNRLMEAIDRRLGAWAMVSVAVIGFLMIVEGV